MKRTNDARLQLARRMRAKYDAGTSIRGLAREYSCAYGTVRNNLLLAKTTLRKRGGGLRRPVVEDGQTGGGA